MSDIVERIDALLANTPQADIEEFKVCRCLRDARAAIESLRLAIRRLAEQDGTLSVQGGNVTVTMDGTLTDAERDAVDWAARHPCLFTDDPALDLQSQRVSDTLRALLARLA